jgi:hypothetical protein
MYYRDMLLVRKRCIRLSQKSSITLYDQLERRFQKVPKKPSVLVLEVVSRVFCVENMPEHFGKNAVRCFDEKSLLGG